MTVGEKIKLFRTDMNMTQSDLAKKINKSRNYISNLENGIYNGSVDTIKDISKALGVSLSSLVDNESEIHESERAKYEYEKNHEDIDYLVEILHKRPDLRVLLDSTSKKSADNIKLIIELAKKMDDEK